MERMLSGYRDLRTVGLTIDLRVTGMSSPDLRNYTANVIVDRAAGRANIQRTDTEGTSTAISDGTDLFVSRSSKPKQYIKRPTPSTNGKSVFFAFHEINATGPGTGPLLGETTWDDIVKQGLTSVSMGKPQVVDGVPVDTLDANFDFGKSGKAAVTFLCRKSDGLLRRIAYDMTVTQSGESKHITITEDHTNLNVNPTLPPATFRFLPPPRATAVTKFE
jgi:hypothetical protein